MDQHVRQLRQQHAVRVTELQTTLDSQSLEIDDLLAQLQEVQAESRRAKHSAEAASQQVSASEKKLAAAKADLDTAMVERAELQAWQQESDSKAKLMSAAARLTADTEVNLQQQISALKQKLASCDNQQEILDWQNRVQEARQAVAELQQDKAQADAKVMQFNHLRDELITRKQELAREHLQHQDTLRALSDNQEQMEQLQSQFEAVSSTNLQKQSKLALLTDKVSQQKQELALASEQTVEARKQFIDSQQAAIALEQQLQRLKVHAVAQNASRQHVQDQLDSTRVQVQEQTGTLNNLVEKLDLANSLMHAKDHDMKQLNEQVQQMQALVAQTQAAKQDAQDTKVQLDASAEQLQRQVQEITSLSGKVEALHRQQAQVTILDVALACSKSEVQKIQDKNANLEKLLASKQDELHTEQAKQKQQQADSASMQRAMETLQRQLEDVSTVQAASQQQLTAAQTDINEYRQQITKLQVLLASSSASQENSSQSILALQETASLQTTSLLASDAKCQTLLEELDAKDEQLKQGMAKLHATEYAAAAAQDAAKRLQARLAGQQTEAGDQSKELSDALEVGSLTVHQLELTIQALQAKVFAAEHAMESQQEQLSKQQAAASGAEQQVKQLAQQLASKDGLITSLQTALTTANFVAESNQQLVSSLQQSINSREMEASEQVKSLTEQLQSQASKNGDLMMELSSIHGKLLAADEAIAAGHEKLLDVQQEQMALAGRVAFLTKLLQRREQREWQAKTQSTEGKMRIREDATDDHEQSCSRDGLRKHVPSAGTPEQLAVLRLTPQANGASLKATIKATAQVDAVACPLSNAINTAQHAKGPAGKQAVATVNGGDLHLKTVPTQTAQGLEIKQGLTGLATMDDKENMFV